MSSVLGRVEQQRGFGDIRLWMKPGLTRELEDSFYGALRTFGNNLLGEKLFAPMYAQGMGRPSVPPTTLAKAVLLEIHDQVSDREAERRAKFDLRWRFALDMDIDDVVFDASSLCRFRARPLANDKERAAFEQFVTAAQDAGLLSGRQIMDATAVHGAGAVQDTYQLIRGAVRKLRRKAGQVPGLTSQLQAVLTRDDYDEVGKAEIDWEDAGAHKELINQLVQDGRAAVAATRERLAGMKESRRPAAVVAAVDLLARVVEQDIEPEGDAGRVRIRQGVAKDRVISTTDPEMRHGHKNTAS